MTQRKRTETPVKLVGLYLPFVVVDQVGIKSKGGVGGMVFGG